MPGFFEFEKNRLRGELHRARNTLDPAWRESANRRIMDRILEWDQLQAATIVHCYHSWRSEVSTIGLIKHLLIEQKKVAMPMVNKLHHSLESFYIQDVGNMIPGAFGIPEPDPQICKSARIEDLRLIIVPGVVFDRMGNRIGSGHGYYDRFLSQTSATRVGLAFGMQVIEKVPAGIHDQKMDFIVTEEEIITCAR